MFPLDTNTRAGRMMAAGQVTVTFRSKKTGEHITLTAKARGKDDDGKWTSMKLADALLVFIEVPNQGGWNDKVGKVTRRAGFTPDANADKARTFCAKQLLTFLGGGELHPELEAFELDFCGACGRALTDPVSIERGIGPHCYGADTGSTHETKVKANETRREAAAKVEIEDVYAGLPKPSPRDADFNERWAAMKNAASRLSDARDQAAIEEHEAAQARTAVATDKKGVPMGIGDWKARKSFLDESLKAERADGKKLTARHAELLANSSQGRITETGDDIPY